MDEQNEPRGQEGGGVGRQRELRVALGHGLGVAQAGDK